MAKVQVDKTKIIRHWRIFWLPGFSIFIGHCDNNPAVWTETKKNVRMLRIGKEEG